MVTNAHQKASPPVSMFEPGAGGSTAAMSELPMSITSTVAMMIR
jgi:hypothetical protein